MAKLDGLNSFAGSLSNVSVYKMRGVDQLVMRTKGGASKQKIKKSPAFTKTRLLNAEWGGCAKAGGSIKAALFPVAHLNDYNISGPLNALAKIIQLTDTVNPLGERHILFSKNRRLLEGFQLNRQTNFDALIRHPLHYTLSRKSGKATVQVPELIPGINFHPYWPHPLFRLVLSLGVIPDLVPGQLGYQAATAPGEYYTNVIQSDWLLSGTPAAAQSHTIQMQGDTPLTDSASLMLAIGIEFGTPLTANLIKPVPRAGCAKILALA